MILFRYLRSKDTFEAFYKILLAKRLLMGKSASFDAERSLLSKLKSECGAGFTSKLEGMFKDVDISRELVASFKESVKYSKDCNEIDFAVNVLTTGYWPTFPSFNVNLPEFLKKYEDHFIEFYQTKHSGRKISFQRNLGTCVVKAYFAQV